MATPLAVKRLSAHLTLPQRRLVAFGLTLAAVLCMAASAVWFRPATEGQQLVEAAAAMAAGGLALGAAVRLQGTHARETQETRRAWVAAAAAAQATLARRLARTLVLAAGLLALLALIESNGRFLGITALHLLSLRAQFALLAAGVVLVTVGLGLPAAPIPRPALRSYPREQPLTARDEAHTGTRSVMSRRSIEMTAVVVITLAAFALRVWWLEDAVHKFVDEIHFSTAVAELFAGTNGVKLLAPFAGITAFPWLYPYWQYEIAAVHGRNLESLRLVSAVLGTLTIPALYLLARTLFDRTTAIMAALLLATFPPHLHFSRIGLNNVADPLFGTLALAWLARGMQSGRRLDYVLAGAALGLTQYFYEGGRLLFSPLVVGWLMVVWIMRRVAARRAATGYHWRHLAAGALAALLVALPVYTTLLAEGKSIVPRMETVAVGGTYYQRVLELGTPQTFGEHLARPFLVYVHMPETGLFYGGAQPLILETLVPVFLLGAFGLLWRGRQPGILILLWVLLTSAGNMLMTESAIFARYVVAFPALALLLALGIRYTLPLLVLRRRWLPALMIALALGLAVAQMRYYFGSHLVLYNDQIRPGYDSEDAMFRAVDFPSGTQVMVISAHSPGQPYLSGVLGYVNPGAVLEVRAPEDMTPEYLAALSPAVDRAFFVEPTDGRTVTLLQQYFKLGVPQFSPYSVPKSRQLVLFWVNGTGEAAE